MLRVVSSLFILLVWVPLSFSQQLAKQPPGPPQSPKFETFDFGLFDSIPIIQNGNLLPLGTAGGLNSPEFSQIDLNCDGILDLFVFERNGFNIKTFINKGVQGKVSYEYAPEYQALFPPVSDMVLLRDFNNDGRMDIVAMKTPSLEIWLNVADTGCLAFEKIDYFFHTGVGYVDYTTSDFFGNFNSNIYVLPGDIPAIEDIDYDGDLDILNFGVWGTLIEYHKNLSVELGSFDTIAFAYQTGCWGEVIENSTSCTVTFGYTCKEGSNDKPETNAVHAGSNMLAIDLDGDQDKDLLLSDISCNEVLALYNDGDSSFAQVTSQDSTFPSYDVPVDLFIFPGMYYFDVDNDSVQELLVAPNIASDGINVNNVWFYENNGTNNSPVFERKQTGLLVDSMVDVGTEAHPVYFDANADGFTDLIIGNYGYWKSSGTMESSVAYYENVGDSVYPKFELVTRDYMGLAALGELGIVPTFGDMDGDGDEDMIYGNYNGKLKYMSNTAGPGNPANFTAATLNGLDSIDVGQFSTPQIFDVNGDGVNDLVIGERNGTINYLKNAGTKSQALFIPFDLKPNFGGVKHQGILSTGYTSPQLVYMDTLGRIEGYDSSATYVLFVSTEEGMIYIYDGIESNLEGNFNKIDSIYTGTYRSTLSIGEMNLDSVADIVIGEYAGGISFYLKGEGIKFTPPPKDTTDVVEHVNNNDNGIRLFPNPGSGEINFEFNPIFGGGEFTIQTIDGKIVERLPIPEGTQIGQINVETYLEGFYIVTLTKGTDRATGKLIIR